MTSVLKAKETVCRLLLSPVRILWKVFSRTATVVLLPVSALAWILFLVILALTLIQLKVAPRWVHYEND